MGQENPSLSSDSCHAPPSSHHQLLLLLAGVEVSDIVQNPPAPKPFLLKLCFGSQLTALLSRLSALVAALLVEGNSSQCQEVPLFPRAWENTPHLTLTPAWRGMLRPELKWDLPSWQAAFLCLGLSDGKGSRGSGTLPAQGERLRAPEQERGKIPPLEAILHAESRLALEIVPLLPET